MKWNKTTTNDSIDFTILLVHLDYGKQQNWYGILVWILYRKKKKNDSKQSSVHILYHRDFIHVKRNIIDLFQSVTVQIVLFSHIYFHFPFDMTNTFYKWNEFFLFSVFLLCFAFLAIQLIYFSHVSDKMNWEIKRKNSFKMTHNTQVEHTFKWCFDDVTSTVWLTVCMCLRYSLINSRKMNLLFYLFI